MKRYRRATAEQRELRTEQIRTLTNAGMGVAAIAALLNAARTTVSATRSRLGIATRKMEPLSLALENKIVRLYSAHFGGSPAIARKIGLPVYVVARVLQERRLTPGPGQLGCRYFLPKQTVAAIRREDRAFQKRLAEKYRLSLVQVKRSLRGRK